MELHDLSPFHTAYGTVRRQRQVDILPLCASP